MDKSQNQTILAVGMDSDTPPHFFEEGDYLRAINIDVGNSSRAGRGYLIQTLSGNKEIPFELPAGNNLCIGKAEDYSSASLVFFIWNSEGNHGIYRFYSTTNTIVKLMESSVLRFSPTFKIHSAFIINDLLYWTDRYNAQRKINLKKAEEGGYLGTPNTDILDLIKAPPAFPPLATYGQDENRVVNYLAGKWFQFRTRYFFDDDENSVLSPVSKILYDGQYNPRVSPYNYIDINYSDSNSFFPRINGNVASKSVITHIEICMRVTNPQTGFWETDGSNDTWRSIERISLIEAEAANFIYRFYNDEQAPVIPAVEHIKLFDAVPFRSGTIEVIKDRIFLADNEEGWFVIKNRRAGLDENFSLIANYGDYEENPPYSQDLANGYEFGASGGYLEGMGGYLTDLGIGSGTDIYNADIPFATTTNGGNISISPSGVVTINSGNSLLVSYILTYTIENYTSSLSVPDVACGIEIVKNGIEVIATQAINHTGVITPNEGTFTINVIISVSAGDTIQARYFEYGVIIGGYTVSFDITNVTINSNNASLVATSGSYKRYGSYEFMLVYFDHAARIVATSSPKRIYIKGEAETISQFPNVFKTGTAWITWKILHLPPKEATHFQWVRTQDLNHNRYLEHVVQDIRYVKTFLEDDEGNIDLSAIEVPYSSAEKKEIYLSLRSVEFFRASNTDSSIDAWTFEVGDRIRLLARSETDYYQTVYDIPIKGMRGEYLVISLGDANQILPEIKAGNLVECYTPKLQSDVKLFYEFGDIYKIGNAGGENRFHTGNTQNQVATEGNLVDLAGTPAIGIFKSGDTYYRKRYHIRRLTPAGYPLDVGTEVVIPYYIESNQISDFVRSQVDDRGRVFIYDANAKKQFIGNGIRFSNPFNEELTRNGLSSFEALNYKNVPIANGRIVKLASISKQALEGNVMLAICEKAVESLYIFEGVITDTNTSLISLSDKVIGKTNRLKGEYGCLHPESVVVYRELCFWYDINARAVLQYGRNGLEEISKYKQESFFFKLSEEIMPVQEWVTVLGGIDPEKGLYVISFVPNGITPAIYFQEEPDFLPNKTNPYPTTGAAGTTQPVIKLPPNPPAKIELTVYKPCCPSDSELSNLNCFKDGSRIGNETGAVANIEQEYTSSSYLQEGKYRIKYNLDIETTISIVQISDDTEIFSKLVSGVGEFTFDKGTQVIKVIVPNMAATRGNNVENWIELSYPCESKVNNRGLVILEKRIDNSSNLYIEEQATLTGLNISPNDELLIQYFDENDVWINGKYNVTTVNNNIVGISQSFNLPTPTSLSPRHARIKNLTKNGEWFRTGLSDPSAYPAFTYQITAGASDCYDGFYSRNGYGVNRATEKESLLQSPQPPYRTTGIFRIWYENVKLPTPYRVQGSGGVVYQTGIIPIGTGTILFNKTDDDVLNLFYTVERIIGSSGSSVDEFIGNDAPCLAGTSGTAEGLTIEEAAIKIDYQFLTTAFHIDKNRWITDYSFYSDYMARVGHQIFVCFKEGRFYLQNQKGSKTLFDLLFDHSITYYFNNQNPRQEKIWVGARVDASDKWYACEIENEKGQETHLIADDFVWREGKFYSHILKDVNSEGVPYPLFNGDDMRSVWVKICFRPEDPDKYSELYFVAAYSIESTGHK